MDDKELGAGRIIVLIDDKSDEAATTAHILREAFGCEVLTAGNMEDGGRIAYHQIAQNRGKVLVMADDNLAGAKYGEGKTGAEFLMRLYESFGDDAAYIWMSASHTGVPLPEKAMVDMKSGIPEHTLINVRYLFSEQLAREQGTAPDEAIAEEADTLATEVGLKRTKATDMVAGYGLPRIATPPANATTDYRGYHERDEDNLRWLQRQDPAIGGGVEPPADSTPEDKVAPVEIRSRWRRFKDAAKKMGGNAHRAFGNEDMPGHGF